MKKEFQRPAALKTTRDYSEYACYHIHDVVKRLRSSKPDGRVSREMSIALTHLETAILWLDTDPEETK